METLKFKTNIKCGGCIAVVTPALNEVQGIKKWEVDTASPDKILTIEATGKLSAAEVVNALNSKGYMGEQIK